ncbi:intermembrane lipid transfer protein Vps13-like [Daktulosphaira vitifoliae]|uniref:intermembrane lipid transfer protein Vps13-like n=1 Tax=Daktulosphaira vitifoliae TaxID=58002 RepID=UPI0021AA5E59|nr:intermembrane lipid transfer protein Vps13-like [Daktulosphaira vitifoliae]
MVGFLYGTKNLLNGTIGGISGVLERITGAMDKGLATLIFSENHKKKRNLLQTQKLRFFIAGQILAIVYIILFQS